MQTHFELHRLISMEQVQLYSW